jgi:hypothetical protein
MLLAASSGATSAATLDFSELGEGVFVSGTTQGISGASLATDGDGFIVGEQFEYSICAASSVDESCANDLQIDFAEAVINLSFVVTGYNDGDLVNLSVFGAFSNLLGSINIVGDGPVDLAGFGAIGSLNFDDSSTGRGFTYRDFTFDVAPIPLPASAWLLLGALGGLGALARRKRLTA